MQHQAVPCRFMGAGQRIIVTVSLEVGNGVVWEVITRVAPQWIAVVPLWALVLIGLFCYGMPLLFLLPDEWRSRLRVPAIGWNHVSGIAVTVMVVQLTIYNWDSVFETVARLFPNYDHLLTRPTCESGECPNFNFRVTECELQAVQVGGLALSGRFARGDLESATEHFRGCLIDRGLSWEPCKRGEPECRFLHAFRTRDRGTALPSFVVD